MGEKLKSLYNAYGTETVDKAMDIYSESFSSNITYEILISTEFIAILKGVIAGSKLNR